MALVKRLLGFVLASFTSAFASTSVFAAEDTLSHTGDSFDLTLWLVLFVLSVGGLVWINSFSKKRARK